MAKTRFGIALLAGCACVLIHGCGTKASAPVYPVRGQVLLNGKPLADAIVSFHAQNGNEHDTFPSAHTDSDGHFTLTTYTNGDGAPEGSYAISLTCFRARTGRTGGASQAQNVVPMRYANPSSSGLIATVVAGDNELQPMKLKAF
ncbi:hypothetical protein BH10PLA2_BH10PLA2_23200 [soil metagenome]